MEGEAGQSEVRLIAVTGGQVERLRGLAEFLEREFNAYDSKDYRLLRSIVTAYEEAEPVKETEDA